MPIGSSHHVFDSDNLFEVADVEPDGIQHREPEALAKQLQLDGTADGGLERGVRLALDGVRDGFHPADKEVADFPASGGPAIDANQGVPDAFAPAPDRL
jgi:hypothetical protein